MTLKILIADDHPIFRHGLKQILAAQPDVAAVGEAENSQKALELARKQRWDVVVLDITMPGRSGLDVLKELRHECPKLPVLILSASPEDQYAVRVLKAGAAGYMTKEWAPQELIKAIRKVLQGEKYLSESVAQKLAFDLEMDSGKPLHETLSDREYQVMRMIVLGKTVKQIAAQIHLSVKTVSTYRARTLEKMKMKTIAELVRYATQNRLID